MRVVTYNIRHGAPPGRWCDHSGLRRSLQSLSADIVALQEVDHRVFRSWFRDQTTLAARATGMRGHFATARSLGPGGRYGNAVLVRGVVQRCETIALDSVGEPRVALVADVRFGDTPLTVISTHLQNRRPGRVEEAPRQLAQLLADAAGRTGPLVLCGDLNLRAPTVEPMLADAGMTAVVSGPTFPSDRPRIRIDWIAVRGLEIVRSGVPDLRSSDHRPVVATLADPGEPTTMRSQR